MCEVLGEWLTFYVAMAMNGGRHPCMWEKVKAVLRAGSANEIQKKSGKEFRQAFSAY